MSGSILAASVDGIEYIKFVGTVRYSHCGGLETHIDKLFANQDVSEVVIDLEKAEILDSTALGLLARVAIEFKKLSDRKPVIFLTEGELTNIIKRVCFDQVFDLVFDREGHSLENMEELVSQPQNEEQVLKRVVEAHRNLARLSKENESLYTDITSAITS